MIEYRGYTYEIKRWGKHWFACTGVKSPHESYCGTWSEAYTAMSVKRLRRKIERHIDRSICFREWNEVGIGDSA